MTPSDAESEFKQFLILRVGTLRSLTPAAGFSSAVDFYRERRSEGVDLEGDGDMLLFQWGHHESIFPGEFTIELTRQFITEEDDVDDQVMTQLSLRFHFPMRAELSRLGAGNRWCHRPAELEAFWRFIESTEAMEVLGTSVSGSAKIRSETV